MKQQTKEKNFAQINGSCKTALHSLRECPFCRFRRGANR